jgi:serine/threonine-protein kinase RsbW
MTTKTTLSNKVVNLNIPSSSEFVSIVRLAVSGIASRMQFTIEDIEDIKISVSEACTNSIQHGYKTDNPSNTIAITLIIHDEKLEITVQDKGSGFDVSKLDKTPSPQIEEDKMGLGLGLTFIKNLMDEMNLESKIGVGTTLKMAKYAPLPLEKIAPS